MSTEMTEGEPSQQAPVGSGIPKRERVALGPARLAIAVAALAAAAALVVSMAVVPSIAPYHVQVRGVYLTLAPLTAGYVVGALCPPLSRRRMRALLAGAAALLMAALVPRLRHDVPPLSVYPVLFAGVAVAMTLARLGMLQAGIGWHGRDVEEPPLPAWTTLFAYAFAWAWLACAIFNPRESFAPTHWLLSVTGGKPADSAAPAQLQVRRLSVSDQPLAQARGERPSGPYIVTVGPLVPASGELLVTASVRRRDGGPFGRPIWLSLDAQDPAAAPATSGTAGTAGSTAPGGQDDDGAFALEHLAAGSPEAAALRRTPQALRSTTFVWLRTSQSLPAVRLRARLWTLGAETPEGISLAPIMGVDLGTWDLTPARWLRRQPR